MESWREELYHHGILGQKWGVRRYQNKDGTLTEAGKRRLMDSVIFDDNGKIISLNGKNKNGKMNSAEQRNRAMLKAKHEIHANVAKDYGNLGKILESGSKVTNSSSSINQTIKRNKQKKAENKIDLSNMSDDELRTLVNRLNMERNYRSLATENVARGQDYLSDALDIVGDVLTIGASAASIALAIHTLKG